MIMPEDDDDLSLDGEGGLKMQPTDQNATTNTTPYEKTNKSRNWLLQLVCGCTLQTYGYITYFFAMNWAFYVIVIGISKILCDLDDWGGGNEENKFHDRSYSSKIFQKEEHRDIVLYVGAVFAMLGLNLLNLYVVCRQFAKDSNRRLIKSILAVLLCCQKEQQEARLKARIPYRDVLAQIRDQTPGISWPLVGALLLFGLVIPFFIIGPASFLNYPFGGPGFLLQVVISVLAFAWLWKVGFLIQDNSEESSSISTTELELAANVAVTDKEMNADLVV